MDDAFAYGIFSRKSEARGGRIARWGGSAKGADRPAHSGIITALEKGHAVIIPQNKGKVLQFFKRMRQALRKNKNRESLTEYFT